MLDLKGRGGSWLTEGSEFRGGSILMSKILLHSDSNNVYISLRKRSLKSLYVGRESNLSNIELTLHVVMLYS